MALAVFIVLTKSTFIMMTVNIVNTAVQNIMVQDALTARIKSTGTDTEITSVSGAAQRTTETVALIALRRCTKNREVLCCMLRKFLIWLLIFAIFITGRGLANSYKDRRAMPPITSSAEANSSGYEINKVEGSVACVGIIIESIFELIAFLFEIFLGAVCFP